MILMNPFFYFSTLYGQLCITLISWGKYIEQLESIEETIGASKHFVKLLGKVSTTLSSALFWQIANLQVGLILWVFVSLVFILFHNEGENGYDLHMGASGGLCAEQEPVLNYQPQKDYGVHWWVLTVL